MEILGQKPQRRIAREDIALIHEIGSGRAAILSLSSNQPVILKGTAVELWLLITSGMTPHELIQHLMNKYELDLNESRIQINGFIQSMMVYGFIADPIEIAIDKTSWVAEKHY
ncbi:PqqD family protein [Arthrobacter sp. A2-55]|uniref:PqqD family protein n=1 Tax=Arthrobacter sp. A2-55 TaxID=2897337 RepID=UPI0021CDB481|nr:PqqD family protein [Arthrobacter sp. A2-55]MCU6479916.1 PqqD family protein [Arthrobacter sp. A2-55]